MGETEIITSRRDCICISTMSGRRGQRHQTSGEQGPEQNKTICSQWILRDGGFGAQTKLNNLHLFVGVWLFYKEGNMTSLFEWGSWCRSPLLSNKWRFLFASLSELTTVNFERQIDEWKACHVRNYALSVLFSAGDPNHSASQPSCWACTELMKVMWNCEKNCV